MVTRVSWGASALVRVYQVQARCSIFALTDTVIDIFVAEVSCPSLLAYAVVHIPTVGHATL